VGRTPEQVKAAILARFEKHRRALSKLATF
jgi:hypothetical protein